ncbi:MAG: hypothetical protein WEG36_16460 [Gemmatimonadota bacterium]
MYGILAVTMIALATAGAAAHTPSTQVDVQVRAEAGEALVTIPGLDIPGGAIYHHEHEGGDASVRFAWPADGWVRGYRIDLVDSAGTLLPREMLHHVGVVDLGRRQLPYAKSLRLFAVGRETEPVLLPESLGVRMTEGDSILVYYALVSSEDEPVEDAAIRITLAWAPVEGHAPKETLPLIMNANPDLMGPSAFDLPPGRSVTSAEFTLPVGGRLRAAGGHLHDHAVHIRLEDARNGRVLVTLETDLARDGTLERVDVAHFQLTRGGLRLEANRTYRVVAVYDNPTGATIPGGAMAYMAGPFVPDDVGLWPAMDREDPVFLADFRRLGWSEEEEVAGEHAHYGH